MKMNSTSILNPIDLDCVSKKFIMILSTDSPLPCRGIMFRVIMSTCIVLI